MSDPISQLLPHLMEIKGQMGAALAKLEDLSERIPDHEQRINSLEHDRTAVKARAGFAGAVAGMGATVIAWVVNHLVKSP